MTKMVDKEENRKTKVIIDPYRFRIDVLFTTNRIDVHPLLLDLFFLSQGNSLLFCCVCLFLSLFSVVVTFVVRSIEV